VHHRRPRSPNSAKISGTAVAANTQSTDAMNK